MMTLWFSRSSLPLLSISFYFFCRPPLSCVFLILKPLLCSQLFLAFFPEVAFFFYSWDRCVLIPLAFFRPIRRGARIRLAKFCFHYLLSSWVRVTLLLCVLEVTLRLFPVLGELAAPPTVRPGLNSRCPKGASFSLGQG